MKCRLGNVYKIMESEQGVRAPTVTSLNIMYEGISALYNNDLSTHPLTSWIMEPGGAMPNSQGFSNNRYPALINPIPRTDTYFF